MIDLSPDLVAKVRTQLRTLGHNATGPLSAPPTGPVSLERAAEVLGVGRTTLLRGLAALARMPFVDLAEVSPQPAAISAISEEVARRFRCLPLFLNGPEITIAVGNPRNWGELDKLASAMTGREVIFALADEALLQPLVDLCYPSAAADAIARHLIAANVDITQSAAGLRSLGEQAPIIKMVDAILARAVSLGASDVHVEPAEPQSRVRFRVDGLLRTMFRYSAALHEAIIARLKIMADLNILERIRPQDGRMTVPHGETVFDARISILRMADGEKAVVRILRGAMGGVRKLEDLEMPPEVLATMTRILAQPHGLFLVTGPTGSGKSSTLYAALDHLNAEDRNLVTIEDPVEYRLAGTNQVPVRPDHDVTFATALRSILRQDPDIVMLGEIRDAETASIAIRAALTGHLVLSTLHTNDAVETVTRLRDMGVPGGDLAPALLGIAAQRLVRRLCECHGYEAADTERLSLIGLGFLPAGTPLPVARGCVVCDELGFRGRTVLFELLPATEEIKRLIIEGASTAALAAASRRAGLRPMAWAGARAVLEGHTTVEEVLRVAPRPL